MVCIDNSQRTSRNFRSQLDAIHLYCHAKLKVFLSFFYLTIDSVDLIYL